MRSVKLQPVLILAAMLFVPSAAPYPPQGAQASSAASGNASVQANKSGAQASSDSSGSASANAGHSSAALSSGTTMNAVLSQPVDAKKNKPGDEVTAKTTEAVKSDGRVVIPKGSRLVGHVTECKPRDKEQKESAVGIVFDRAILKHGEEVPLNASIQALAAAQSATAASASSGYDDVTAGAGGGAAGAARGSAGGALGGVRSTAGGAAGAVTNTAANAGGVAGGAVGSTVNAAGATRGAVGGLNAAGQLTSNSQGVFGLNGLNLNSAASNSTQGSLITSTSRNVHLDSGTQMLLMAQGQASGPSAKPESKK